MSFPIEVNEVIAVGQDLPEGLELRLLRFLLLEQFLSRVPACQVVVDPPVDIRKVNPRQPDDDL